MADGSAGKTLMIAPTSRHSSGGASGFDAAGGLPKFGVLKISLPLSVRTIWAFSVMFMYGAPLFTFRPLSVIFSPIFGMSLFQPNCRVSCCPPPISACHRTTLPPGSVTSNTRIEWGLVSLISTTVPVMMNGVSS